MRQEAERLRKANEDAQRELDKLDRFVHDRDQKRFRAVMLSGANYADVIKAEDEAWQRQREAAYAAQ